MALLYRARPQHSTIVVGQEANANSGLVQFWIRDCSSAPASYQRAPLTVALATLIVHRYLQNGHSNCLFLVSNQGLLLAAISLYLLVICIYSQNEHFSSRDLELWPMILTFKLDLDIRVFLRNAMPNIWITGLAKVIIRTHRDTQTQIPDRVLHLDH